MSHKMLQAVLRVIFNEECQRHKKWFTKGSSKKLPRTNKNLIIETRNENIYTQKLKIELNDHKMVFDSPRLKAVSDSASLIAVLKHL